MRRSTVPHEAPTNTESDLDPLVVNRWWFCAQVDVLVALHNSPVTTHTHLGYCGRMIKRRLYTERDLPWHTFYLVVDFRCSAATLLSSFDLCQPVHRGLINRWTWRCLNFGWTWWGMPVKDTTQSPPFQSSIPVRRTTEESMMDELTEHELGASYQLWPFNYISLSRLFPFLFCRMWVLWTHG